MASGVAGRTSTSSPRIVRLLALEDALERAEVRAGVFRRVGAHELAGVAHHLRPHGAQLLEQADMPAAGQPRRVSALDIDPLRRRVRMDGSDLRLTEQEFQLLYFLAGSPGRVFGREALLDAVWGSDTFVTTRSVDALVKRLRHQLRTAGGRESVVETVRGVGYRLAEYGLGAAACPA